jgi:demethylmenaquinone methyltransferase/2-methoxy-6-polyprenyl-1,4-benzoquinol methylase
MSEREASEREVGEREVGDDAVLRDQLAYYRARAAEYDEWFLRRGRWDRGPAWNARWFAEVDEVRAWLDGLRPAGRVLGLACGTGLWTERIARHASHVTALDAAAEVLAVNRARLDAAPGVRATVRHVEADLFRWRPDARYDVVFFGFWLTHVPPARFEEFWRLVRSALAPGGRAIFVDSLRTETSTARDHRLAPPGGETTLRRLNDGREFRIYKVFYDPSALAERLRALGWSADVRASENFFVYGCAR